MQTTHVPDHTRCLTRAGHIIQALSVAGFYDDDDHIDGDSDEHCAAVMLESMAAPLRSTSWADNTVLWPL